MPIDIDNTDVSDITIDGQNVSEVTADGNVVWNAIPDSVVSREQDDSTNDRPEKMGLKIEVHSDWSSIGARISENTSGTTRAYLWDDSKSEIESVDISSLSAGDAFTFDDVNLESGNQYFIVSDAEGSEYTGGFFFGGNFPYETSDIDIIGRYDGRNDVTDTKDPFNINDIGDVGFA